MTKCLIQVKKPENQIIIDLRAIVMKMFWLIAVASWREPFNNLTHIESFCYCTAFLGSTNWCSVLGGWWWCCESCFWWRFNHLTSFWILWTWPLWLLWPSSIWIPWSGEGMPALMLWRVLYVLSAFHVPLSCPILIPSPVDLLVFHWPYNWSRQERYRPKLSQHPRCSCIYSEPL